MPVPSSISDLSSTASSNYPGGSEAIGTSLDDYLRSHAAIIRQVSDAKQNASANLDEYAAVNPTAAGLALLDDADAAAQRATLGLVIGTDVQAYDADIPTVSASQAEMEAGTETALRSMSPLRVKQAIDALVTPTNPLTLDTVKTASGTSVDFTSIPSWIKRITVMMTGVSSSGTSNFMIQIGDSGGIETSGYTGSVNRETNVLGFSSGFVLMFNTTAATSHAIQAVLTNVTGNTWIMSFVSARSDDYVSYGAGYKTLTGVLDRVRITTVGGSDTFDAGSINIMYE